MSSGMCDVNINFSEQLILKEFWVKEISLYHCYVLRNLRGS